MMPIAFKIGPFFITSFGLFMAIGFLFGIFTAYREVKDRIDVDLERFFDALLLISFGAFLGGRIAYIFLHWSEFGFDLLAYVLLRERPGLSFTGAVLGALLLFSSVTKSKSILWYKIIDNLVPSVLILTLFGQIGSLLDGFSFGIETHLPWGVSILGESIQRHPLPGYFIVFILFLFIVYPKFVQLSKDRHWPLGTVSIMMFTGYLLFTLFANTLRYDQVRIYGASIDQMFALVGAIVGFTVLYFRSRNFRKDTIYLLAFCKKRMHNIANRLTKQKGKDTMK